MKRKLSKKEKHFRAQIAQVATIVQDSVKVSYDELAAKVDGINNRLDKLNGSVLALKLWRAYLSGAVAVILAIGVPVAGYLLLQIIHDGTLLAILNHK